MRQATCESEREGRYSVWEKLLCCDACMVIVLLTDGATGVDRAVVVHTIEHWTVSVRPEID